MSTKDISINVLREYLEYNAQTGFIVWKKHKHRGKMQAGDRAGCIDRSGYEYIRIGRMPIASHIIAWTLFYGVCPNKHIDHINGDRKDNRIDNLRLVTSRQNQQNRSIHRSGRLPGASPMRNGKWQSRIGIKGKTKYLGVFNTAVEAHCAYQEALREVSDV